MQRGGYLHRHHTTQHVAVCTPLHAPSTGGASSTGHQATSLSRVQNAAAACSRAVSSGRVVGAKAARAMRVRKPPRAGAGAAKSCPASAWTHVDVCQTCTQWQQSSLGVLSCTQRSCDVCHRSASTAPRTQTTTPVNAPPGTAAACAPAPAQPAGPARPAPRRALRPAAGSLAAPRAACPACSA